MINASDSVVGQRYKTQSNLLVEVVEKRQDEVVLHSFETNHDVPVPLTYKLEPVIEQISRLSQEAEKEIRPEEKKMSEEVTTIPTPAAKASKPKKVKKSNIVDEGLRANLSLDEIVKNVLATFPETTEKSIRNLVSVRRSKQKKTAA